MFPLIAILLFVNLPGNGENIVIYEDGTGKGMLLMRFEQPVFPRNHPGIKHGDHRAGRQKRMAQAADDYLNCFMNKKDALLITGTNKDRSELNSMIRPELVKKGLITDSQTFNVFHTKNVSGAAALSADSYKPGTILITTQEFCDFKRGVQCEVVAVSPNTNDITVKYFNNRKQQGRRVHFRC